MNHSWEHSLESGVVNYNTLYPICMYDEGLGTVSDYEANPENANFVEINGPNCFPDSRLDFILSEFIFTLTKGAIATDNLLAIRVGFMPVFVSFEDQLAIDELSGTEVRDVLELQSEATDRQAYPLFNGVKMVEKYSNSALLDAAVPGLTSTQVLEAVAFSEETYYDALQYMTIGPKLKACQGGLKWFTLTERFPIKKVKIKLRRKNKNMKQFGFFGVMVIVPNTGTHLQYHVAAETTAISHVRVNARTRFNEWHQDFNMKKV